MNVIEGVIVGFGGDLDIANGPIKAPMSLQVMLYSCIKQRIQTLLMISTSTQIPS